MANKLKPNAIKSGMGGSRSGRGRSEKTAVMKRQSKKLRRQMARAEVEEQVVVYLSGQTYDDWLLPVSVSAAG